MTATNHGRRASADIGTAQNAQPNLRLQTAARHFYKLGMLLQFGSTSVNLFLALASPFTLLLKPEWGPTLGAIAGAWLFISRQLLAPFKRVFQVKGAEAQELFDCSVLGLDWNDAMVRRIAAEEIGGASRKLKNIDKLRNWYPVETAQSWPASVLICQRANAVWARRQHRAYGHVLRGVAFAWAIVGISVALVHGASLGDYLIIIALPSLPALLDASELADKHRASAASRERLEEQADLLLAEDTATRRDLREIQDQLFGLRAESPMVPSWFYRLLRSGYEQDMQYAASHSSSSENARSQNDS